MIQPAARDGDEAAGLGALGRSAGPASLILRARRAGPTGAARPAARW
jgi:hypothetical protein